MRTKAKRSTHELASLLLTISQAALDAVEAADCSSVRRQAGDEGSEAEAAYEGRDAGGPQAPQSRPGRRSQGREVARSDGSSAAPRRHRGRRLSVLSTVH